MLVCSVLFAGLSFGAVALGLVFGIHVSSIVQTLVSAFSSFGGRLGLTFFVAIAVGCLYYPALRGIGMVAIPVYLVENSASLSQGDVVWYSPMSRAEVGDLVVYDVPSMRYTTVYQVRRP